MTPEQEKKGNIVAIKVWEWLQEQKTIEYVPWAVSDSKLIAAKQEERMKILDDLEKLILRHS
jgi:hypothetical protein